MKSPFYSQVLNSLTARLRFAPPYTANFDSATGLLRATAAYLRGEDFPGVGMQSPAVEPLALLINQMPQSVREFLYASGANEAIAPERLSDVRSEAIAQWIVNEYPQQQYPAVAIGSSSGALVHLCAALGMPWLPQTTLIPVRHPMSIHPDSPSEVLEWSKPYADALLAANPDLKLHHMFDPNADRLMVQSMTYFRVKWLRLSEAYKQFLEQSLPPGGTIFIIECQRQNPTTQVSDRHIFQFGGLGGVTPEEFLEGGEVVAKFLEHYQSPYRQWKAPLPDGNRPESEWGFEPALGHDIESFAKMRGYKVRRIVFQEPEHLSPFVAQLYHWWYKQRQIEANRLLVESFIQLEPMWTLRTGSVPFWVKFNMEPSFQWLEHYLDNNAPYDEIYMMLFSNGVDSIRLVPIERWQTLLKRARQRGSFIGVQPDKYPRDFATIIRYYTELPRTIKARYPLPGALTLEQFDRWIREVGDRFPVHFLE
ncbi:hypothetical protein [Scytonema sp. NUACC26]|uniref:hypothetical protein n=1 Tax=Scytonema sp. NUACC26 TaxID=3140176 RepID=UPI0034DC2682